MVIFVNSCKLQVAPTLYRRRRFINHLLTYLLYLKVRSEYCKKSAGKDANAVGD